MEIKVISDSLAIQKNTLIRLWLWGVFILILAIVMLGGATRLTHAGLSIVEWKPISGIIPPFTLSDWMLEFERYKASPEYLIINKGMRLADFKFIFWMEYSHRLLGRFIGLYVFIPMLYFWTHGMLDRKLKYTCIILLILGGLQGAMGWYMVKSGLVNNPHVSPFRLSVHLLMAFALAAVVLLALRRFYVYPSTRPNNKSQLWHILNLILIIITIFYGALVAGHKAGFIYNTFPLMEGVWIPSEWLYLTPLWRNFIENAATIQFIHRQLAYLILISTSLGIWMRWISPWYGMVVIVQLLLGILTLLYNVPILLGTLHQGWALIVFSVAFWSLTHRTRIQI